MIELLVVIAIIAILAAILFPVLTSAKENARTTTCMNNLKTLAKGCIMYGSDNNGKFPGSFYGWLSSGTHDWCGCLEGFTSNVHPEMGTLWRYVKTYDVYRCPSDKGISPTHVPSSPNYPISYSMNWLLGPHYDPHTNSPTYNKLVCTNVDSAPRPSKVLLLIHEGRENIDDGCFYWWINNYDSGNKPSKIHFGGTAAVYLDGHAKRLDYNAFLSERESGCWDPEYTH